MNYRYRIDNADIILSPEEDTRVKTELKKGSSIIYLRGDALAINVNFIRYVKKTHELTEEQEANRHKHIALPERSENENAIARLAGQKFMRLTHNEFYASMGWEHKNDCICKTQTNSDLAK